MRTPCLKMLCNVAQFLPRQATSLAFSCLSAPVSQLGCVIDKTEMVFYKRERRLRNVVLGRLGEVSEKTDFPIW